MFRSLPIGRIINTTLFTGFVCFYCLPLEHSGPPYFHTCLRNASLSVIFIHQNIFYLMQKWIHKQWSKILAFWVCLMDVLNLIFHLQGNIFVCFLSRMFCTRIFYFTLIFGKFVFGSTNSVICEYIFWSIVKLNVFLIAFSLHAWNNDGSNRFDV